MDWSKTSISGSVEDNWTKIVSYLQRFNETDAAAIKFIENKDEYGNTSTMAIFPVHLVPIPFGADEDGQPYEEFEIPPISCMPAENGAQLIEPFSTSDIEMEAAVEEDARSSVSLSLRELDGYCARQWGGKMYFLKSTHRSRTIVAIIETTWTYRGQRRRSTSTYRLSPFEDSMIGCNIPGPTNQRFDRKLLSAYFA